VVKTKHLGMVGILKLLQYKQMTLTYLESLHTCGKLTAVK